MWYRIKLIEIRREYELRNQINLIFKNAYEKLASKYKTEYKVSKVKDCLLEHISSLQDQVHQVAYGYIRSIVNVKEHGKDIDRTEFVTFVRNDENKPAVTELNPEKREFVIADLSRANFVSKPSFNIPTFT